MPFSNIYSSIKNGWQKYGLTIIQHLLDAKADFVLMVENYITKQKNFVFKDISEEKVELSEPLRLSEKSSPEEIVINGSIIKITTGYYVGVNLKSNTVIAQTQDITVNIVNQNNY